MAEKPKETTGLPPVEGHGDDAKAGAPWTSPGTFIPLSQDPQSVNQKSDEGKKGAK